MRTQRPWRRLGKMIVGNLHAGDNDSRRGDVVCSMHGAIGYKNLDGNARLIAAAPDLLEECREAERLLSLPFNHRDHNGATFEGAAKRLRAIIANVDAKKEGTL